MGTRREREPDPDLTVAGLSIWFNNRERGDDQDYWDGNWLSARARVDAPGATVRIQSCSIRTDEIAKFLQELETLSETLSGTAALAPMEPDIGVRLEISALGQITARIEATPDMVSQGHWFDFSIDQTDLAPMIRSCRSIMQRFPVKGAP